jgi:hypothetical protein
MRVKGEVYCAWSVKYSLPRVRCEMYSVWNVLRVKCEVYCAWSVKYGLPCEVWNVLRVKCEVYCAWSVKYSLPCVKCEMYCMWSVKYTACEMWSILRVKCEVYCVWNVKYTVLGVQSVYYAKVKTFYVWDKNIYTSECLSLQQNLAICARKNSFRLIHTTLENRNEQKRSIRTTGWRRSSVGLWRCVIL